MILRLSVSEQMDKSYYNNHNTLLFQTEHISVHAYFNLYNYYALAMLFCVG